MKKFIIIGITTYSKNSKDIILLLIEEMHELIKTLNGQVAESFLQIRRTPDSKYYVGKGKLIEVIDCAAILKVDTIIFINELSPSHIRNIEEFTSLKTLTRRDIILQIFAKHAKSKLSKAEVELAQLKINLSRLVGSSTHLSRLGGGIGTRGPGEKKLETDRRKINIRIKTLNKILTKNIKTLNNQRKRRESIFKVALVGYTNAGKSSLLNVLTHSKIAAENQLFSTIDTTTRKLIISQVEIVISDTVGFIKDLPTELIQSFKATLEEVVNANLLLLIIDISEKDYFFKFEAVNNILESLNCLNKDKIIVYNKIDIATNINIFDENKKLLISTKTLEGIQLLKERIKYKAETLYKTLSKKTYE